MDAVRCPRCEGRAVGRVGVAQWFCWDCCVEFQASGRGYRVYAMDEEGELVPLDGEAPGPEGEVRAG